MYVCMYGYSHCSEEWKNNVVFEEGSMGRSFNRRGVGCLHFSDSPHPVNPSRLLLLLNHS